jgi:mannose-1-phosphate guanylyltransferase
MKAFLLAAGFGERLRPLSDRIPKPLMPVMNVPSICYAITVLKDAGISEVVCNLHHMHAEIADFFREHDNFGLKMTFSHEETILGTGGGLAFCREHFKHGPFVYINSDIVVDINLKSVVKSHQASRLRSALVVSLNPNSEGRVTLQGDRIVNLRNLLPVYVRPEYDFIGIAVLYPEIFRYLKNGFSDIVETGLIELVKKGLLGYYRHEGVWHDIGTIESYRSANAGLINMSALWKERIFSATRIMPCAISNKAIIENGASIARSVVGEGCRIGAGAVVTESVILPGTPVREGESIVHSVKFD